MHFFVCAHHNNHIQESSDVEIASEHARSWFPRMFVKVHKQFDETDVRETFLVEELDSPDISRDRFGAQMSYASCTSFSDHLVN